MSENLDLEEIERKAYIAYHDDGLLDVFIGGYLVCAGIASFIETRFLFLFWCIVQPIGRLLYDEAKKRVTYPRLGYVRFTKKKIRDISFLTMFFIMAAGIVTLTGLFTYGGIPELMPPWVVLLNRYNLLFDGGVIASIFLFLSKIMNIRRLSTYSVITLIVFAAGYIYLSTPFIVSTENIGIPCILLGGVVTGFSAVRLHGFISRKPEGGISP
ncbi:hypothetical protein JXL21_02570 [Candidatus Bathyarchaeota archaeon]|nr:hypothetical protein [Candidatus Bathyarchaeota archaeon]